MALDPISALFDIGGKLIDRLWPDPTQAAQAKLKLFEMQQTGELAKLAADTDLAKAGAAIVQAEAASKNWLASSWRPVAMYVFIGLIVARWFGYGAANLQPAEYLELWTLVKIGMGGYVIGRSAEKIVPAVASAVASKK